VAISWEEQPRENALWSAQLRWDALPARTYPAGLPKYEIAGDSAPTSCEIEGAYKTSYRYGQVNTGPAVIDLHREAEALSLRNAQQYGKIILWNFTCTARPGLHSGLDQQDR
jgi:hypothetical protein